MNRRHGIALAVAIVVATGTGITAAGLVGRSSSSSSAASSSSASSQVALPSSMASTGDSLSRAFDLEASHFLRDAPEESWSTGSDAAVNSHYDRIMAAHGAITDHVYNDAKSGAKMVALAAQLKAAADQQVDYATVLMGANDLCAASVAAMTPTATFQSQFDQALAGFFRGDPQAHVFVSSIPDLFRLWDTLRTNPVARLTWGLDHICPSMLDPTATAAERQQVVAREQADNTVLATVCHRYPRCRFDGHAVYQVHFSAADVSSVDYFHPSQSGQKALAAVTWAAGYWPSTR